MPVRSKRAEQDGSGEGFSAEMIEQIRRLHLFSSLTPADVGQILEGAEIVLASRETDLFMQNDPADCYYILLSGQVALLVTDKAGRKSIIEVVKQGDTFGEEAIFDRGRFPFGARTLEKSRLIRVPADAFFQNISKDFRFVLLMMASISSHLRFLVKQVGELKLKTTEQRLASYILALAGDHEGNLKIRLPYDKKILASQLGMKPESLSRALAKLREQGVSTVDEGIYVESVADLRDYCSDSVLYE